MDPKDIEKLAKILRDQGDKLLTSEFKFTLTGDLLRSLNDSFSLIIDENETVSTQTFQVTKPNNSKSNVFRELMFIHDFIQKTQILKLIKFLDDDPLEDDNCVIDISKFRNLTTLEIQRVPIKRIIGLRQLRSQLQVIVAERSLSNIKDLIMYCAGDKSNGFIWNCLKRVDFSYNNLEIIDSSFEFTPYLQHLNLSHNKIYQISQLVWCPNLKVLNLSFNQLTSIPKLNVESTRRLQSLIINDNLIEDITGLVRLDALLELDISGNCMMDHSLLLPLCTLNSLRYLNLSGNPLAFHPKHRSATCRYLSRNASSVKFQLDGEHLSRHEKTSTGCYENYYPNFGHRMTISTTSSRATPQTPSTKSISNTPDNSSLGSANSFILSQQSHVKQLEQTSASNQKRMKPRTVVIEESGGNHKQAENKSPQGAKKLLREGSKDHLTTKREIEQLREQFGSDWLYNQGNVVGFEENKETSARKKLMLGDLLSSPVLQMDESFDSASGPNDSSTPIEDTVLLNEGTLYKSVDDSTGNSFYASALDETFTADDEEEEIVISDPEDNEAQYIVTNELTHEDLILVVSEVNIKEKDAMNGRTLAKWGLSTLESVERTRSNLIRLNFDTIRKDKRERQFRMDTKCCQELERMLRDYLSSRPLSEMNQTVYKCPKCNSQFSRENDDRKKRDQEIKCPCGNKYVIEIHNTTKCETIPPKASFLTGNASTPSLSTTAATSVLTKAASSINIEKKAEEGNSGIPKTSHSFSSIESAFDSNQSVAGSSVEVLSECSSQASHVSQTTSQSSIEVIDYQSRKPSEERRMISQAPSLDTIEDDGHKDEERTQDETLTTSVEMRKSVEAELLKPKVVMTIGNVNLTESSSSGSVCESVVTAYEGNGKKKAEKPMETSLDNIFKSSTLLLSKTPKPKRESESGHGQYQPIQYNLDDLSVVDHRVKLHLFQNILEENDEKLMWLVKTMVIEDDATSPGVPFLALVVMSTKKLYVLKVVGDESEDINSWLKKSMLNSIDRIEAIREIPSKSGFTFVLKSKTNIHLLLQDQILCDRLRSHINTSNQNLEIVAKLSELTRQKLMKLTDGHELKCLALFQSCVTSMNSATGTDPSQDEPKLKVDVGILIVTTESIHLTTNFHWLCENIGDKMLSNRVTITQPMSNLVELENVTKTTFTLCFMDELENTLEKWNLVVDSYPRIARTLECIDEIWQKIFCVPLINDDQILS